MLRKLIPYISFSIIILKSGTVIGADSMRTKHLIKLPRTAAYDSSSITMPTSDSTQPNYLIIIPTSLFAYARDDGQSQPQASAEDKKKKTSITSSPRPHKRPRETKRQYQCSLCGLETTGKNYLDLHYMRHAKEHVFKCDIDGCTRTFVIKNDLRQHQRFFHNNMLYMCPYCPRTTKWKGNITRHIKTKHAEKIDTTAA